MAKRSLFSRIFGNDKSTTNPITSEQLDKFFETNDYTVLLPEENEQA